MINAAREKRKRRSMTSETTLYAIRGRGLIGAYVLDIVVIFVLACNPDSTTHTHHSNPANAEAPVSAEDESNDSQTDIKDVRHETESDSESCDEDCDSSTEPQKPDKQIKSEHVKIAAEQQENTNSSAGEESSDLFRSLQTLAIMMIRVDPERARKQTSDQIECPDGGDLSMFAQPTTGDEDALSIIEVQLNNCASSGYTFRGIGELYQMAFDIEDYLLFLARFSISGNISMQCDARLEYAGGNLGGHICGLSVSDILAQVEDSP